MAVGHVLLVTTDRATAGAVAAALDSNGKLAPEDVCRSLEDAAVRLEQYRSPAVLVDAGAEPGRTLVALEPLVRQYTATRFVLLSESVNNDLLLEAMQTGVRHVLLKRSVSTDLTGVLRRLIPAGSGRDGAVVSVLSANGGAGATTIAVNLANELQLKTAAPALIVDMDHHYGAVAAYLGVDGEYGLVDILARTGPIDSQLLQSTRLTASDRLDVLLSTASARLTEPVSLDPVRLSQAVKAFRDSYTSTVLDAPRMSAGQAADLAKLSTMTLVVFQLTVKDIRNARALLSALAARGVPEESLVAVANRYRKRGSMITLDEAERALAPWKVQCVGNDYKAATEAINLGQTLAKVAPSSDVRHDIKQIAVQVCEAHARARHGLVPR